MLCQFTAIAIDATGFIHRTGSALVAIVVVTVIATSQPAHESTRVAASTSECY